MSNINPDDLKALVCQHITDAQVDVHCYSGEDQFEMTVIAASVEGQSRVKRHQMV